MPESFSKSRAGLPCCRRLRWDFDAASLAAEFQPGLWSRKEVSEAAGRLRFFLIGGRGDHNPRPSAQLARLPLAAEVLAALPGALRRAHYSLLEPRARVSLHQDGGRRWEFYDTTIRLHLPLRSNPRCALYVDGSMYRMRPGELWMLDSLREHGAVNDSSAGRLHLIVDLAPDRRLLALARDCFPDAPVDEPGLLELLRRGPRALDRVRALLRRLWR